MKLIIPNKSPLQSKDFTFGVATAAFQIEGGADSRLPSIWDTFCDTEGKIADQSNGKFSCDHYSLWKQDVKLINFLSVDAYRLSISWPRLIKQDGTLNQEGADFYINLLDAINEKGIKPFVTFYHWDLPQYLEDKGGWLNRETAYHFLNYVDLVSKAFGNRVYSYATLNEPFCSSYLGYETGTHAPGIIGKEYGKKAAHHLLLAHGLAIDVLNKNCPEILKGVVLNFTPCYPKTQSKEDIRAAQIADDQFNQWYIKPIFDGSYPDLINGIPDEHKPDILQGDMEIISSPIDFLGVNYYTRLVYETDAKEQFKELEPQPPTTDIGWEIYPKAMTELLISLNDKYTLPPIYITENGCAMADTIVDGQVNDLDRFNYLQSHLSAVDDAMTAGVNVKGYFTWSLMDNFEWSEGYTKRFGIVYVDFKTQQRTIKNSGYAFKEFLEQRK